MEKSFENLTEEEKKAMYESWVKSQQQEKETPKREPPIRKVFIPLGTGYNAQLVLWDNNLQIVKSKKENNEWTETQKINLSRRILTELFVHTPMFIAELESREQKGEGEKEE